MTTAVIIIFVAGYILIAMENLTHINKSAVALLMAVLCWTVICMGNGATPEHLASLTHALGETGEILFFLIGAMVIVEVVDNNSGIGTLRNRHPHRNHRKSRYNEARSADTEIAEGETATFFLHFRACRTRKHPAI